MIAILPNSARPIVTEHDVYALPWLNALCLKTFIVLRCQLLQAESVIDARVIDGSKRVAVKRRLLKSAALVVVRLIDPAKSGDA